MGVSPHGRVLRKLLPPGKLFSDAPGSMLQALLDGLGIELDRSSELAKDLPRQLDPAEGDESLSDWERVLGLPDGCGPAPVTVADRRRAVLGRLQSGDNLSRAFYVELARAQGYTARVEELESAPFRCGSSRAGETLGTEAGVFAWNLVVRSSKRHPFRVGASRCGTPLVSLADAQLECVIQRAAPAHTQLGFRYEYDGDTGSGGGPGAGGGPSTGGTVDECWWLIDDPSGPDLRMVTTDGEMVVYGEDGAAIDLGLRDGAVPVLDENGVEIEVPVQCEIEPDPEDECWWLIDDPSGPDLRMVTTDGEMVVYGEDGATIDLGLRDGAVPVLDENGVEIEVPVQCELAPEEDCALQVGTGSGAQLDLAVIDDALGVQDQSGGEIRLAIVDQALPVLDADGETIRLPLSCGNMDELWWHVLDPDTGEQLNVRTAGGSVLATLEDGSQLAMSSPDQPFTVLDEAGHTLTISLSAEQA